MTIDTNPKPKSDNEVFQMLRVWREDKVKSIFNSCHPLRENKAVAPGWHKHFQSYGDHLFCNWKITSPNVDEHLKNIVMFETDVLLKLPTNIGGMKPVDAMLSVDARDRFQDLNWVNVALKGPVTTDDFVKSVYEVYKTRLSGMGDYVYFGLMHGVDDVYYLELWDKMGS